VYVTWPTVGNPLLIHRESLTLLDPIQGTEQEIFAADIAGYRAMVWAWMSDDRHILVSAASFGGIGDGWQFPYHD